MPAQSEKQQRLFAIALSVKRGHTPRSKVSDGVLKIVDNMSEKKIKDFVEIKNVNMKLTNILRLSENKYNRPRLRGGIVKSKEASMVLQLMDKDYSYEKALNAVLKKYKTVDRKTLEKELNKYI